jgi:CheY-like chemotaxis protein
MLFGKKERRIVRLLLVEDEPLVAFDTEHFLTGGGFEVVATLDTVADALACLEREEAIDLVLVDVTLSDGSGVDVARAAHARGINVMFVTGNFPEEARRFAAGCIAKPYPQRDLLAAIGVIDAVLTSRKVPKRMPGSFTLFLEPAG